MRGRDAFELFLMFMVGATVTLVFVILGSVLS